MNKQIFAEKAGQKLKVEYFSVEGGSGCRFYINENLVKEETYPGHNIAWAQDAAENWIDGIKTLNG